MSQSLWQKLADSPPFLIAEVGQNHDGSLGQAHAFIDAIAATGAHAVKFQTHIAAEESCPDEPFRVNFSYEDATRFDYWRRMEFNQDQWQELERHANERDLVFLSSPFSLAAVELLDSIGVPAWKVASGEVGSRRMIERMAATGKPLIVSTGMSGYDEIDDAVLPLRQKSAAFVLMQCTSAYPSPLASTGLNVLDEFRKRYECPVGLSDHSGSTLPAVAAALHGAQVIEVHVTLGKQMFGPDVAASLDIAELRRLAEDLEGVAEILSHTVDKDWTASNAAEMRRLFGKSAVAVRALDEGAIVTEDDVTFLKPSWGIAEKDFDPLMGKRLKRPVPQGKRFEVEDFQE